jgi:hypothetical protein
MPLVADSPADRAGQMVLLTDHLTDLIARETALMQAREPPLSGAAGDEKARLANLYRQEMTRIGENPALLRGAPPAILDALRLATARFREALAAHERALIAIKEISEGIVRAIAEEVARQRGGPRSYARSGAYAKAAPSVTAALALNKTA